MKKLIIILFLIPFLGYSQTKNINPSGDNLLQKKDTIKWPSFVILGDSIAQVRSEIPDVVNYGDNRILTSDGTTKGLNAESGLKFSDYKLSIRDVQTLYIPDQTNFENTLIIGNGGNTLFHTTEFEGQDNTICGLYMSEEPFSLTTGTGDAFFGKGAGANTKTGSYDTYIGSEAGASNGLNDNDGDYNLAAGAHAATSDGNDISFGYRRGVYLGYDVRATINAINEISIGCQAHPHGSNTTTIGDNNQTDLYCGENGQAKIHATYNYAEKTENYTATNSDNYLNFTDTAHDNDTCFLTSSLNVGKVLTIRRDDVTNDVVLSTTGYIHINKNDIHYYNITGTTQSVVIICTSSNKFQIMIKGL